MSSLNDSTKWPEAHLELCFKQQKRLQPLQTSTEMAHTRLSCDDSPRKHMFKKMFRAESMKKIVFVVVIMLIYMYVSSEKGDGRRTCSKADSVYRIQLFDLILIARPEDVYTPSKRVGGFLCARRRRALDPRCPQETCSMQRYTLDFLLNNNSIQGLNWNAASWPRPMHPFSRPRVWPAQLTNRS